MGRRATEVATSNGEGNNAQGTIFPLVSQKALGAPGVSVLVL